MTNSKAAKFNVSKKLAQLNKVIALFKIQNQEREFRLKYLHDFYDPQIEKALNDAWEYKKNISENLDSEKTERFNKYQGQYEEKSQTLISDIEVCSQKLNEAHQNKLQAIEKETTTQKSLLKNLIENSQTKKDNYLKNIEAIKSEISEKIKLAREKYQAERNAHFVEAEKRMQQCKKESEERINQLQADHRDKLIQTRGANKTTVKLDSSKLGPGVQRLSATAQLLIGHKNKLMGLKETTQKVLSSTKSQIDKEISDIKTISDENKDLLSRINQQIDEIEKPNQESLDKLRQSQKDQLQQFSELENQQQNELNQLIQDDQKELDQLKLKNKDALAQYNAIFGTLNKEQSVELEELQKRILALQSQAEQNQKNIKKEIKKVKAEFKKVKSALLQELEDLKKKNEVNRSDYGHELYQEREAEIKKHQINLEQMKKQIESLLGDDAKKIRNIKDNIKDLENNKETILSNNRDEISRFEQNDNDELSKLQSDFFNQSNELSREIAKSLEDFDKQNNQSINDLIESNNEAKEQHIQSLNIQNQNEIDQIQNAGFSKDEYNSLESKYQQEYDQFQNNLNQIQPPKLEDNAMYRKLISTIEQLNTEFSQHQKNHENEKDTILKNYNKEELDENKRHEEVMRPTSSGRVRDQAKMGMMKKLDDMRKLKQSEIDKYTAILNELIESHMKEMNQLEIERVRALQQETIDKLKADLQREENDGNRKEAELISKYDTLSKKQNKEIEETVIYYIQQNTNQHALIDKLIAEFEQLKKELLDKISSIQVQSQFDLDACQKGTDKLQANMNSDHSMQVHQLLKEIESISQSIPVQKEKNENELKNNSSQRQNEIDEYVRSQRLDIKEKKNQWKGMEEFFEERINVLTAERNKFKSMFESRPSRECDLENIEKLSEHLKRIQAQLQISLKDYSQYKAMYVEQEKKYNAMFGKNPKVGILQFNGGAMSARPTNV